MHPWEKWKRIFKKVFVHVIYKEGLIGIFLILHWELCSFMWYVAINRKITFPWRIIFSHKLLNTKFQTKIFFKLLIFEILKLEYLLASTSFMRIFFKLNIFGPKTFLLPKPSKRVIIFREVLFNFLNFQGFLSPIHHLIFLKLWHLTRESSTLRL